MNSYIINSLKGTAFFLLAVILCTCMDKEAEPQKYPRILTLPVTDINENGAVFNAEIIELGTEKILEYGFVWEKSTLGLSYFDSYVKKASSPENREFSLQVSHALKENEDYHVKAYAKTSDRVVYGTLQEFKSLGSKAPELLSMKPREGVLGDTVELKATGLTKNLQDIKVKFGLVDATIVSLTDTLILAIVPLKLSSVNTEVSLSVVGNKAAKTFSFDLKDPLIKSFEPTSGADGAIITLKGENFGYYKSKILVKIGPLEALITTASKDELQIKVPEGIYDKTSQVSITIVGNTTVASELFVREAPRIDDFNPKEVGPGDTITIDGAFFSSVGEYNLVQVGESAYKYSNVRFISFSPDQIVCSVPESGYGEQEALSIQINQDKTVAEELVTYLPPVIESIEPEIIAVDDEVVIKGEYFSNKSNAVYFNGKKAYRNRKNSRNEIITTVPSYISQAVVEVEVKTGELSTTYNKLLTYIGAEYNVISTSTNLVDHLEYFYSYRLADQVYIGLGTEISMSQEDLVRKTLSFDLNTETWAEKEPFPGETRNSPIGFSAQGYGYVGLGVKNGTYFNDLWRYDPSLDQWTQMNDFPGGSRVHPVCFEINGDIYLGLGEDEDQAYSDFYKYDPHSDQWEQIADFPYNRTRATAFVQDGVAYVGLGAKQPRPNYSSSTFQNEFYKYEPDNNSWQAIKTFPGTKRERAVGFTIDGKSYVGLGWRGSTRPSDGFYHYSVEKDSWYKILVTDYNYFTNKAYVKEGEAMIINPNYYLSFDPY